MSKKNYLWHFILLTFYLSNSNSVLTPMFYYGSGSRSNITSSTSLNLNTWYHVAYTQQGAQGSLYINGSLVGSGSTASQFTNATYATLTQNYIGYSVDGDGPNLNGSIDDLMIFNRSLSQSEIFSTMKNLFWKKC